MSIPFLRLNKCANDEVGKKVHFTNPKEAKNPESQVQCQKSMRQMNLKLRGIKSPTF